MTRLERRAVLIVEDEPLIAIELAEQCAAEGATPIIANSVAAAFEIAAKDDIDAAVLEHKVQQEDCNELCEQFSRRGVPFLTYTSWSNPIGACRSGPIVEKPVPSSAVVDILIKLVARPGAPPARQRF